MTKQEKLDKIYEVIASIQAKASIAAKYRDDVLHELRLVMSEFIK